jgi:membrane associated rhomboid family serine protease
MLTSVFDSPWVELQRFDAVAAAEEHALVLAAMGIACQLIARDGAIGLEVAATEAARAAHELAVYDEENRPPPGPAVHALAGGLNGALVFCVVAVFLHAASNGQWFSKDWWGAGSAQAGLILGGEWWRTLTALGLHADAGHLVANLVMGSLFGVLLAERLGSGLAWLAILLAGGAGNALNAWVQPAAHTSIGASTGVFAALGLLAALSWKRDAAYGLGGLRRWLPLAGGVMLLSFLGVGGERTDIGAHVFGFLVGALFGAILHTVDRHVPRQGIVRHGLGVAALALFALAWLAALGGA